MGGPKKILNSTNSSDNLVHIALLRGINVGGRNRVSMEKLRHCFESVGCEQVQSYIQSGNLVFLLPAKEAESLSAKIAAQMQTAFGFSVPIIVRTMQSLQSAMAAMPFDTTDASASFQIVLLASTPSSEHHLDRQRSPEDQFVRKGDTLYIRYGAGIGRSKFTNAYIDKALQTTSTARNLKTLTALVALADHKSS